MRNEFKIIGVLAIVMFMVAFIAGSSFAMPDTDTYNNFNLELVNSSDMEILKTDIINFIDLIDDNLIPNTSFNFSSKLNENYDFLTKFAISFILDNSNNYDIKILDNYIYNDEYGNRYSTNKYVSVDALYDVTNSVFGVEYYYILNDYLEPNNGMIPLIKLNDYSFNMNIEEIISMNDMGNYLDVVVKYDGIDLDYIYTFNKLDNKLYISNLSVGD